MPRRRLLLALFALLLLSSVPTACAQWKFFGLETVIPWNGWPADGRIRMPDGTTLVPEGALVQFIVDTEGDGIDDPLEHFDSNGDGRINSFDEAQALREWISTGADPSAFCDDALLSAENWDGKTVVGVDVGKIIFGPGEVVVDPVDPYLITNTATGQAFAWRCWNLNPDGLAAWGGQHGEQLWYTTGRECGSYDYYGLPYDGWWVGAPAGAPPGILVLHRRHRFRGLHAPFDRRSRIPLREPS